MITATLLLLCARRAGNGPLHECCRSLMLANKNNPSLLRGFGGGSGGGAADGTQPVVYSDVPVPEPQTVGTGTAARAATYHHGEALPVLLEAVPLPGPPATGTATAATTEAHHDEEAGLAPPLQAAARTAATAAAAALTGEQQIPPPRYDTLPPARI